MDVNEQHQQLNQHVEDYVRSYTWQLKKVKTLHLMFDFYVQYHTISESSFYKLLGETRIF
jgi:hypothetical protein